MEYLRIILLPDLKVGSNKCRVLLAAVNGVEQNGSNRVYYFRALSTEIISVIQSPTDSAVTT